MLALCAYHSVGCSTPHYRVQPTVQVSKLLVKVSSHNHILHVPDPLNIMKKIGLAANTGVPGLPETRWPLQLRRIQGAQPRCSRCAATRGGSRGPNPPPPPPNPSPI